MQETKRSGRRAALRAGIASAALFACVGSALAAPPSFGPRETIGAGQNPSGLTSADFDGDGSADVATTDFDGVGQDPGDEIGVDIFRNDGGDFVFEDKIFFEAQPDQIVAARVNGDSDPDLVVGTFNGEVELLRGAAGAGFKAPVTIDAGGESPREIAVADFTGDGRTDVVAGRQNARDIVLISQRKNRAFAAPKPFKGLRKPTAVRLNADKRMDLVALTARGQPKVRALIATKNGFRRVKGAFPAGDGVSTLDTGDVNNDGKADVIAADSELVGDRNVVSVLLGKRGAKFARPQQVTVAQDVTRAARRGIPGGVPTGVVVRDLNGDERADLAVTLQGYDRVSIAENRTRSGSARVRFGPAALLDGGDEPRGIVAARLDPGSSPDLAWVGAPGLSRVLQD